MSITAFTKISGVVESHESIQNTISEPVKVISLDKEGAQVPGSLPPGQVVIYDVVEYDEEEREEFIPDGYEPLYPGSPESPWIPVFRREVHIDRVPRTETYAVTVAQDVEEVVAPVPGPVIEEPMRPTPGPEPAPGREIQVGEGNLG